MCGLPGSGKSTLSRALAERLGAVRWDKDEVRHLLFAETLASYDRRLNDLCMELLYFAAQSTFRLAALPVPVIILDGRPFMERAQRDRARSVAREAGIPLAFVLCTAPMNILQQRVAGEHLAPDRDAALIDRLAATADSFEGDAIRIDTGTLTPGDAVARCVQQLTERGLLPQDA